MKELPSGTVTLLFTDIEGSTKLLERVPKAFRAALARHHAILGNTVAANDGRVFETIGDGIYAAFSRAEDAVNAALAAQHEVHRSEWGEVGELRVRMALHTGALELWSEHYFGPPLYRLARLLATGHGGQILLSRSTYELVRDALPPHTNVRDLGEHRLKDLGRTEHVFQLVAPNLRSDFPPLRSLDTLPTNLPPQLTSFVGREREMAEVKRLLLRSRLVTLIGSGGVGKTRLALQVGADLLDAFGDGVWLVELAALTDPALLPQAVASSLSLQEEPGQPILASVISHLRRGKVLLVLDNCEHVVEAAGRLAEALLRSCSDLRLLATSREALGVAGETSWRVPSLAVPDANSTQPIELLTQYEAVRLFIDRALAVRPDFLVTDANAPSVTQICHRLDGIPLAIELAAVRVSLFAPEEIAARLEDRFHLLTGGRRTSLARHRTLQALIDWSYELLSERERMLLRRLSVFAGGWTFDSAEAVGGGDALGRSEVLDALTQLVNKSLVIVDQHDGHARYRLLQTVRQYAQEKLLESGETESVRDRHLDNFVNLAEEAESRMRGPEQRAWYERLEAEQDNLRAAFAWSQSPASPGAAGLRLAAALWGVWNEGVYPAEVRRWLDGALDKGRGESGQLRSKALYAAGYVAIQSGGLVDARVFFEQSLTLARQTGEKAIVSRSLLGLSTIDVTTGDFPTASSLADEALALARTVGDVEAQARALRGLGDIAIHLGHNDQALARWKESVLLWRELGDQRKLARAVRLMASIMVPTAPLRPDLRADEVTIATASRWLDESLTLSRDAGDMRGVALSLGLLGWVAVSEGHLEQGRSLLEQSTALSRQLGDRVALGRSLRLLGLHALYVGDHSRARAQLEECRAMHAELDQRLGVSMALCALGRVAQIEDDRAAAQSHYEESLSVARAIGNNWAAGHATFGLGELARQRVEYDRAENAYQDSLTLFRTLNAADAAEVGPMRGLALVALAQADAARAAPLFEQGLRLARKYLNKEGQVLCLSGLAEVAAAYGRSTRAARLFGATEALLADPLALDSVEREDCEQALVAARDRFKGRPSSTDQETFAAAWADGHTFTLERAVACALDTTEG